MSEAVKEDPGIPPDPYRLVYIIFYWLGVGTLLPWNFFISVPGYWMHKWRTVEDVPEFVEAAVVVNETAEGNETVSGLNEMQTSWGPYLSIASMVPNVTILLLNAAFGHHFRTQPRLLISLALIIVFFIFTDVMTLIEDTDHWQDAFFVLVLASVVVINVCGAIFQGGLLGLVGKFPPQYIGGTLTGQSLGGIFASATNVIFIAVGGGAVQGAFYSFFMAVIFLASALAAFLYVTRLEFFKHFAGEDKPKKVGMEGEVEPMNEQFNNVAEVGPEGDATDSNKVDVEIRDGMGKVASPSSRKPNPLLILARIALYGASVFLVFTVTLGCFPAITMLVQSTGDPKSSWSTDYFVPVVCFVLFNVGDWIGRILAERLAWPSPGKAGAAIILACSLLRFAFIPLFLMCNVSPQNRPEFPVVLESDAAYIVIMILFSVSNGYIASISMMSAPQICKPEERQTASSLMVALLSLGLGVGALTSRIWVLCIR